MSYIDLILTAAIVICTWLGYRRGFINSFSDLIKWSGAFIIVLTFYEDASVLMNQFILLQKQWKLLLSFFTIFIISFLLLSIIFSYLNSCIDYSVQKNIINRIAGIIPGFLTGIVTATIIAKLLSASLLIRVNNDTKNSILSASLIILSAELNSKFQYGNNLGEQEVSGAFEAGAGLNESDEFKCGNFYLRPDLELQLLQLVNAERIKRGIKVLSADNEIQKVAHEHATDMFKRGYFSHKTPEGIDPFERIKKAGIIFIFAGENLAHSSNLFSAHEGLMHSPGHRANILNPSFGRLGITILDGGSKGLMLVQEFRD